MLTRVESFSQEECKALADRLATAVPHKPISLTYAHGFFCALASAPHLIMPSFWQPFFWGEAIETETAERCDRLAKRLLRFQYKIKEQLRERYFTLLLWSEHSETSRDGDACRHELLVAEWCRGYLDAAGLDPLWMSDQTAVAMLFPFRLLANDPIGSRAWVEKRGMDGNMVDRLLTGFVHANDCYWDKLRYPCRMLRANKRASKKIIGKNNIVTLHGPKPNDPNKNEE